MNKPVQGLSAHAESETETETETETGPDSASLDQTLELITRARRIRAPQVPLKISGSPSYRSQFAGELGTPAAAAAWRQF